MEQKFEHEDLIRKIREKALDRARKGQIQQTGFFHYHPKVLEGEPSYAIPVYENFLFALILLRTKTHEHIVEAKILLDRLFNFQDTKNYCGAFPIYVHEFMHGQDYIHNIRICDLLLSIYDEFHAILGDEIRKKIEGVLDRIGSFIQEIVHKNISFPCVLLLAKSLLKRLGNSVAENSPVVVLEEKTLCNPYALLEYIRVIQRDLNAEYSNSLDLSLHNNIKNVLSILYSKRLSCYAGPHVKIEMRKTEREITAFDLFMNCVHMNAIPNVQADSLAYMHLERFLSGPFEPFYISENRGGKTKFHSVVHEKQCSSSSQKYEIQSHEIWGYSPFALSTERSTVVLQTKCAILETFSHECGRYTAQFNVKKESFEDEKGAILSFFIPRKDNCTITISGKPTTVFSLNDCIEIEIDNVKFSLRFTCNDGAQLQGQIHPGNRSGQLYNAGESRFNAYDWMLYIRPVRAYRDVHTIMVDMTWH